MKKQTCIIDMDGNPIYYGDYVALWEWNRNPEEDLPDISMKIEDESDEYFVNEYFIEGDFVKKTPTRLYSKLEERFGENYLQQLEIYKEICR